MKSTERIFQQLKANPIAIEPLGLGASMKKAPTFKISENYWNTLNDFEKLYFQQRFEKEALNDIKKKISVARKSFPNYVAIQSKGFLEDADGKIYLWNGLDRFTLLYQSRTEFVTTQQSFDLTNKFRFHAKKALELL